MSSTTEPQTFGELQVDFISRMKESNTAGMTTIAKRFLNNALVDMHRSPGTQFSWPERPGRLITHAPYSTGTITIAEATSRTYVQGNSTNWTTPVTGFGFNNVRAGGKIKFGGQDNYTVASVSAPWAITLTSPYVGADISSGSYLYYEDEYSLALDFESFVDLRMFSTDMEIPLIGRTDFRRIYPRNDIQQRPKVATHIQLDFSATQGWKDDPAGTTYYFPTVAQHRVVLHPAPDQIYQIPYWYKSNFLAVSAAGVRQSRMIADTDEPVVPAGKRQAITLYAMYEYYRDYKDDMPRAQEMYRIYSEFMKRIAGERDASDARPRLVAGYRGLHLIRGGQRYGTSSYIDGLRDFRRWNR